jgi:hypothetical protein
MQVLRKVYPGFADYSREGQASHYAAAQELVGDLQER